MTTVEILKEMAFTATETQRRALEDAISDLSENKGDLISRQKVLNTLDFADNALDEERTVEKYKELLTECIKVLPSVEKKGEWIESKERSGHWYCSICGGIHTDPETGKWREIFDYKYPFCPNCGADMRGEADEKT